MSSIAAKRRITVSRPAFADLLRRRADLFVLGGSALVLRLAWVLVYGRVEAGPNDTFFYESAAAQLARGHGFSNLLGQPTAHWPPGFPFLVSLLYRAFGEHRGLALGLNVVLATATTILVYLVAQRMFGRLGARIAGGAHAILPGPIFMTALFLSETLFAFMLVGFLALVLFLPNRRWMPAVLGVAVGLTALTRGEGMLLPVIPLAIWWGRVPRRVFTRRAAVLVAVAGITILPWTIRNASVMGAFIPVSTNASSTLWAGHNPKANGGPTYYLPPSIARQIPGQGKGGPEQEVAEARVLRREAIKWAVHNPLKELGLIPRKLIALNGNDSDSLPLWLNAPGDRQVSTSGGIVFTTLGDALGFFLLFTTLASLVILSPRRLWRLHPGMRGVLTYLAASLVAYGFVYYGQWRYRIPMEPFMLLVATPILMGVWVRRRNLRADLASAGGRVALTSGGAAGREASA
jgi:4-amino-4-deoxy-L-arabinose transferase-like glycosyltransferase